MKSEKTRRAYFSLLQEISENEEDQKFLQYIEQSVDFSDNTFNIENYQNIFKNHFPQLFSN